MKKVKGLTNRIVAMLMSGMLVVGAVPGTVLASDIPDDIGQTSEIAAEVPEGTDTEEVSAEAYSENTVAQEEGASAEEAAVQYYTVTLDANGGYFENEWDDALGEAVEQAEVVKKQIPVGGTVDVVPVFTETDQDGQLIQTMAFAGWSLEKDGELITTGNEEYVPVDNCVLYAVWEVEDVARGETAEQDVAEDEENREQVDGVQESEKVDVAVGDTVVEKEGTIEEDTVSEVNTDPETENEQDIVPDQQEVFADEDVANTSDNESDAAVAREETQPELIESSEEDEIVREDAAKDNVYASGTCGDNLLWEIDPNANNGTRFGLIKIYGQGEMWNFTLEEKYDPRAFYTYYRYNRPWDEWTLIDPPCVIDDVVIEEGVTSIGDYAFYDTRCGLYSVTIPSSVKRIGEGCFGFCNLDSVIIPSGVQSIDYGAFRCCKNLIEITIPPSVINIGESCFDGCPESLTIYCEPGSYAEQYAKDNSITFKPRDSNHGKYKVFFDKNGGSEFGCISSTVTNGSPYGTSVAWTPSRDGYIFTGWYTSIDGGTKITEDTVVNLSEDQTLYAHWKEGTYTVTFDPNGGIISQKTKIYTGVSKYGVFPPVARSGFELKGWFYSKEKGTEVKSSDQIKYSDHTLYAQWLSKYNLIFDATGGQCKWSEMDWTSDIIEELPIPSKNGYDFDGWYTSRDGGKQISIGDKVDFVGDKTIYAHWTPVQGYYGAKDGWPLLNNSTLFGENNDSSSFLQYYEMGRATLATFIKSIKETLGEDGSCFGLALLSVAQYKGMIDLNQYTKQNGSSLVEFGYDKVEYNEEAKGKIYSISGNDSLKKLIQRAQASQFSTDISRCRRFSGEQGWKELLNNVGEEKYDNPFVVKFATIIDGNKFVHAVVLESSRKIIHNPDLNQVELYCYDPNSITIDPTFEGKSSWYNSNQSKIIIDTSNNKWRFYYGFNKTFSEWNDWDESISIYDISDLNSDFFHSRYTLASTVKANVNDTKDTLFHVIKYAADISSDPYAYVMNKYLEEHPPVELPCKLFDEEMVDSDYISTLSYACGFKNKYGIDLVELIDGNYAYHFKDESQIISIKENEISASISTFGNARVLIGNNGLFQVENEGNDTLSFTMNVSCVNGTGVATAEGTLDSGNKIAVAPDNKSDDGYVVIKTDEDLDDIHTTISIDDEVVENDFHEEGDNPDETLMSGTYGDAANWSLSNTGCLTISGTGELNLLDQEDPDQEDQPWYEYKDEINKVVIKDGITKIGDFFFYGYKNLKNVSLPGTVASVGQKTFSNTPIVYLRIPCEDFTLGYWSFYDCTNLKSIYFKGLAKTDIDYQMAVPFQGCTNLTDVTVNSGIIGKSMFRRCTSIKNVKLGSKVTEIGESAFEGCTGISSIDLPSSLTIIGENAFCDSGIEEVFFPESLTSIGHSAFRGTKLKEITFPDSFTTCPAAFRGCNELSSIRFGKNMTSIEGGAFFQCNSLTEIVIPDSIQSIESAAFYDCPNLLKVTFGKSLNYLGYEAFASCDKLEEVKLTSNKLLDWENNSFANDTFVLYYPIYNDHTLTAWQYGWQLNEESEDNGSGGITWKSYLTETITGTLGDNLSWAVDTDGNFSITGHGKMEIESASLFCPWKTYKRHIKKVDIQSGITSIGEFAFGGCEQLLEVNIPESVEEIGEDAFRYCRNLKEIDIPDGVTIIDVGAFNTCTSLKKVVLPASIDCIKSSVFEDCSSLTDIYIPNSVTEIWPCAFNRCYALKTLTIPEGVALIGPEAFVDCKGLESIIVHSSKLTIYSRAFVNCSSLKEIHFKSDAPVFSLKSVDSPVIGDEQPNEAFKNDILTAYYPGGNPTWSEEIFKNYGGTITWTPWYNDIAKCAINITTKKLVYNGKNQVPEYIVKEGQKALSNNIDYVTSFKNNKNAGTATMTITGRGNYAGTKTITFTIDKAPQAITASNLSLTFPNSGKITATGNKGALSFKSSNTAIATVDSAGKVTAKGAGKATITITAAATSNYNAATKTVTVTVAKAAQSITAKAAASSIAIGKTTTVSITGAKGTKYYKSSDTTIATVTSAGKVTAKKVGTVKITATSAATANYNTASKTVTIKVVPAATASLTAANQATGIKLTWKKVTGANGYKVYRGSTLIKTITSGSTVTFADTKANTNGTKYTYKVVAKASTGDSTLSKSRVIYRVSRPAVSSVTNSASKKMTVKWGKNAKANGYQIQYSTDKNFKSGNKAVSITSASTVSKVIGSLTKGKTYYVRIRTYKTVGSTKYWSIWSAARSVKISK